MQGGFFVSLIDTPGNVLRLPEFVPARLRNMLLHRRTRTSILEFLSGHLDAVPGVRKRLKVLPHLLFLVAVVWPADVGRSPTESDAQAR